MIIRKGQQFIYLRTVIGVYRQSFLQILIAAGKAGNDVRMPVPCNITYFKGFQYLAFTIKMHLRNPCFTLMLQNHSMYSYRSIRCFVEYDCFLNTVVIQIRCAYRTDVTDISWTYDLCTFDFGIYHVDE
ncbi:hypothetical protein D3C81_1719400 [compost metagenome]